MEVQDDDLDSQVLRDMAKGFMGDFDLKEETPDFDATYENSSLEQQDRVFAGDSINTLRPVASVSDYPSRSRVQLFASQLSIPHGEEVSNKRPTIFESEYRHVPVQALGGEESPSQDNRSKALLATVSQASKMSQGSFDQSGPSYYEGKTQEVSPRVYEEYHRNQRIQLRAGLEGRVLQYSPPENPTSDSNHSEHLESARSQRYEDNQSVLLDSSPEPFSIQYISEMTRFPRTPATYGKKRKLDMNMQPNSAPRLPHNPLSHYDHDDGTVMELSQVFNATQRPTSPLQGFVSDPLTDRPSPDIFSTRKEGLQAIGSSPLQVRRTVRASTEPQSDYITMEESQEERMRRLREEALSSATRDGRLHLDDGFDSEQEQIRQRRKDYMRRINEDTTRQFISLQPKQVPIEVNRRGNSASSKTRHGRTSSAGDVGKAQAIIVSDDTPLADEDTASDDTEGDEEVQTQIASIELAATRPRSTRNVTATPKNHVCLSSQKQDLHQTPDIQGSQIVAVADSQRSQLETPYMKVLETVDRLPTLPSSAESRELVAQSQHMNSRKKDEESSVIPRPPPISSSANLSSSPVISRRRIPNRSLQSPTTPRVQRSVALHHGQQDVVEHSSPPPLLDSRSTNATESISSMDADKENVDPLIDMVHSSEPQNGPEDMDIDQEKQPTQVTLLEGINDLQPRLESQERPAEIATSSKEMPSDQAVVPETSRPSSQPDIASEDFQMSPSISFSFSQRRHSAPASPDKRAIRTLTEIAAASPRSDVFGEVDTDFRIMSTQDLAYQEAIQSSASSPVAPSRKRRRGIDDHALQQSNTQANQRAPSLTLQQAEDVELSGPVDLKSAEVTSPVASRRVIKGNSKRPKMHSARSKVAAPEMSLATASGITLGTISRDTPTNVKETMLQPKRIFAKFKGGKNAYYPATCLSVSHSDQPMFKIRFDDGMVDSLPSQFVRQLDLRQGDVVKVDLDHMRTKNYIVLGFKNRMSIDSTPRTPKQNQRNGVDNLDFPMTDIWGYENVVLAPKHMDSLPSEHVLEAVETVEVPLTSIYIVQLNWVKFANRPYTHSDNSRDLGTKSLPVGDVSSGLMSNVTTPSVRGRNVSSSLKSRSTSSVSPSRQFRVIDGLFRGMVFAVSYTESSGNRPTNPQKAFVTKEIITRGGTIVDEGFDELFDIDDLSTNLSLTSSAKERGFTCLIADKHSRKAKYMQALALGLPCVSGYWIEHCVQKEELLSWQPYLLAAGDCSMLGGCTVSRSLPTYSASSAKLETILDARPKLLADQSVLLVTSKGKSGKERKAYPFLAKALGAVRIERVANLELARKKIEDAGAEASWDLVHVPGIFADAEQELFDDGVEKLVTKRKKSMGEESVKKRAKILSDEMVIQSLILGKIVDAL